jgi:hypothetical protein
MCYFDHAMRIAGVLALGLSLTACESIEALFDTKKPLPGERKPVFSDGVPGVPQGVPAELVRGYQPPPESQPPAVVETPVQKPAEKPKSRPRATTVAVPSRAPATNITVQPSLNAPPPSSWQRPPAAEQSQPPPQQAPQQAVQQSTPQPPPWQAPSSAPGGAQAPTPWPSAPPPGTFSR